MELLTIKPLRHQDTIDLEVVALDDAGATVTYTAHLTKDLTDILSVSPDDASPMTSDLIEFVRATVIAQRGPLRSTIVPPNAADRPSMTMANWKGSALSVPSRFSACGLGNSFGA